MSAQLSKPNWFSQNWQRWFPRQIRYVNHFERVLGTALEIQIFASNKAQAIQAEGALLTEIDRLEGIFSRFNPVSELNRWQATEDQAVRVSAELYEILERSQQWQDLSGGAFHPGSDGLSRLWALAASVEREPSQAEIEAVLQPMRLPLWSLEGANRASHTSKLSVNFNAFAKGYIADKACAAAKAMPGVSEVLVNIGGDLRHMGQTPLLVAIENPFTRADNVAPVAQIRLTNQGVATSGRSRRGFQIGDRWFSHVIDPRSGRPVEHTVAASVIAPHSATADVLATVFSVLSPQESLELADRLPDVGCLLITPEGAMVSNAYWQRCAGEVKPSVTIP